MQRDILTLDRFAPQAEDLRTVFDQRFADPRRTHNERFCWDYWHVPDQYTALRTPAWTYFPKQTYEKFHNHLVQWGRRTLGCHDISPPWLSCYVEGCGQQLHGDLPHGPWAFVYSLTRWRGRIFSGGETQLLRNEMLDYWQDFISVRGLETSDIIRTVAPKFGRLTVFDPAIPHGVRTVHGTHDPRFGRLVIHGWFVQPRPFIQGPVVESELAEKIGELTTSLESWLAVNSPLSGLLSLGLGVSSRGLVQNVRILSDTTRSPSAHKAARLKLIANIRQQVSTWKFATRRNGSRITLPLLFERS